MEQGDYIFYCFKDTRNAGEVDFKYHGMKTNLHGRPSSTYRGVKGGVAKGKVNLTKKDLLS